VPAAAAGSSTGHAASPIHAPPLHQGTRCCYRYKSSAEGSTKGCAEGPAKSSIEEKLPSKVPQRLPAAAASGVGSDDEEGAAPLSAAELLDARFNALVLLQVR